MKILVIRRDNIGDLVCTTPVFSSLRRAFPTAYIAALVNSYSAPVISNNPDINDVFTYTKGKHGANEQGVIRRWKSTLSLLWKLRARQFDVVIAINKSSLSLARLLAAKRIITAGEPAGPDVISLQKILSLHAVEAAHNYLSLLGIQSPPGPLRIYPDPSLLKTGLLPSAPSGKPFIGLHLSARKSSQRWPVECFALLAKKLFTARGASFRVFWSPGTQSNPLHPGDDEKAEHFRFVTQKLPVQLCPTTQLGELIAAMSLCDLVICGDGGAMHIGAGLGKPVIALFGDSDPQRWRPWGVPNKVLQAVSRDVADITVEDVLIASLSMLDQTEMVAVHEQ
jgi:ADP-heptose:LPS heptosyltransferase